MRRREGPGRAHGGAKEGEPAKARRAVVDMTALKGDEEQLRSHAQILDSLEESVIATDLRGRVCFWSRAAEALYGHRAEEVLDRPASSRAGPEAEREEAARLEQVREAGRWNGEQRLQRKDGSWFWSDALICVARDASGRLLGCLRIDRDITRLKEAEEQARRLEAELAHAGRVSTLGEMAAALAHEISQPLAAISNYVETCAALIAAGETDREEMAAALREATLLAHRATGVIQRIRDLARKQAPQRSAVDVNRLVGEVIELVQGEVRQQRVSLSLDLQEVPMLHADGIQLQQVILNLVRNALDALKGSAVRELSVRTAAAGRGLQVTVRDTGCGFPPQDAERIFEPFYSRKPQGLGLGLAISRSIIRAHGGRLWADPGPGTGAAFHFTLPMGHGENE